MNAALFATASRKKFEQIADELIEQIRRQQLRPGDRLPAERTLAATFAVAPGTIRQALDLLAAEGLVERVPKSGTFVRRQPPEAAFSPPGLYLDSTLPTIFTARRHDLVVRCPESDRPGWKVFWQHVAKTAESNLPNTRVRFVSTRDARADCYLNGGADLLRDWRQGLYRTFATETVRTRLDDAELLPLAWDGCTDGERTWAVPFAISMAMSFWNGELLAAVGREEPPVPGLAGRRTLLAELAAVGRRPVIAADFIHFILYQLVQHGIDPHAPDGHGVDLKRPEVADVLRFNREMFQAGLEKLRLGDGSGEMFDPWRFWAAFREGSVLVLSSFSYALGTMHRALSFPLRLEAPPLLPRGLIPAVSCALAVAADSAEAERALEFAALATGPEAQRCLAETQANIPVRRDLARDTAFLDVAPASMAEAIARLEQAEHSMFVNSPLFNQSLLQKRMLGITQDYYAGRNGIETTLDALQELGARLEPNPGALP